MGGDRGQTTNHHLGTKEKTSHIQEGDHNHLHLFGLVGSTYGFGACCEETFFLYKFLAEKRLRGSKKTAPSR